MKNTLIKIIVAGKRIKKIHLVLLVAFTLLSSAGVMAGVRYFSSQAAANTCRWTGATSSDWDTATNWSCTSGTVPGAADAVYFDQPASNSLVMTASKTVAEINSPIGGTFNKSLDTGVYSLTVNGPFTWQRSTLNGGASEFTVSGNLDLSSGTFNYSTSHFILTGDATTLTPKSDNSTTFYNLTVNKTLSSNAVTIQTANFSVRNIFNVKKGKVDGVGRSVIMPQDNDRYQIGPDSTGGNAKVNFTTTGYVDASGGVAIENIEMSGAAKNFWWNGSANLKNLTLSNGTMNIQSGKLTFPASTDGSAGKFSCSAGTMKLEGTAAGSMAILRSDTPGSTFYLENNCGATTAAYVDIKDANNTSGAIIASNSIDSGNNTGFDFATSPLAVNKWISDTESNWNNAANWSLGHVPTSTENVYFGQGHNGDCNQDVAAGVTVASIISSDYSGSINTQNYDITATGGLTWAGGTFNAGSSNITTNGKYGFNGGSWNAGSSNLTIGGDGSFLGAGFEAENSRVIFSSGESLSFMPGATTFNDLEVNESGWWIPNRFLVIGTAKVLGDFIHTDGDIAGGQIDLSGNYIIGALAEGGDDVYGPATAIVNFNNAVDDQSVIYTSGGIGAQIRVDKRGGNLILTSNINVVGWIHIQGNVIGLPEYRITFSDGTGNIFSPGSVTYGDIEVNTNTSVAYASVYLIGSANVAGNFIQTSGAIGGGNIALGGNYIIGANARSDTNAHGETTISFTNSSNQEISCENGGTGVVPLINKTSGGSVTINGDVNVVGWKYITGVVNGIIDHRLILGGTVYANGSFMPGGLAYGDLEINKPASWYLANAGTTGTANLKGNLYLTNGLATGGTFNVDGNVVIASTFDPDGHGSSATVNLVGTTDQTYTISSGTMPSGDLTINKPSGKATITGTGALKGNIALTQGQLDFAGGSTYTMTVGKTIAASAGTRLNFNGSVGNLVTFDSSDASTAINITKPDGVVIGDYVNMNHTNVSGGAKFYSTANFTGANNTGWTTDSTNIRTISAAGGNWSSTAAWNEGAVPTSADNVIGLSGSGNIAVNANADCASLDLSLYAGTLSGASDLTITGPASISSLIFGGTITATSTLKINPAIGQTILFYSNGMQWTGSIMTSTAGQGGTISLQGGLSVLYNLEQIYGTITTNNHNILTRAFNSQWATTRTLNQGTSTITCFMPEGGNAISFNDSTNLTYDNAGGTWVLSNNGVINLGTVNPVSWSNQTLNISGATTTLVSAASLGTINVAGTESKTGSLTLYGDVNVTNLNIEASSTVNRILVRSSALGTARTITANAVALSNADFQDIAFAGTMTVNSATSIGDCGGNSGTNWSGIVTPAATQTWTNAAGGNWSDATNWSGRVPLPQDDVNMARVGGYNSGVTVTADMPRLGKSIDWTGASYTGTKPTWLQNNEETSFGSLTMISEMTFSSSNTWNFVGRSDSSITCAGKSFGWIVTFNMVNSKMSFNDVFSTTGSWIDVAKGELTANSNVTVAGVTIRGGTTINMGSGLWTVTGSAGWQNYGGTINKGSANISMGAAAIYFLGSASTYNDIQITPGPAVLTFYDAFAFNNMTMSSAGARPVKFTKDTTYTMTGTNFLSGSAGNLVTIDTNDGTGTFTLNKTSGMTVADYVNVSRATVQGGAKWYLTPNSTQTDCTGWDTTDNNIRTVSAAGGNWDATTTWNEGVVPAAADEVYALPGSGNVTVNVNAVARNLNFYNYLGTLTHNAATTISVGDASGGYLNFAGNWTYTKGSDTTSELKFVSASNNSTNGWPITWGGKVPGNVTFDGVGGGWYLRDSLVTNGIITLTKGSLNTNNQAVTCLYFDTQNANTRSLVLGSTVFTVTRSNATAWYGSTTAINFQPNTSTIILNGSSATFSGLGATYTSVRFTGGGNSVINGVNTFTTLSVIGTSVKTDTVSFGADQTVTDTLSLAGNSAINRLLVQSNTVGTARNITTASANVSGTNNVDFQDITFANGGSNVDLSASSIGDCGGNTGITFTPGVTQTWTNAAGGNWSTASNWTSRVPLPQDPARFQAMNAGQTIAVDMPRLPDTDFSGATNTPTVNLTTSGMLYSLYGNINLTGVGTFATNDVTIISHTNVAITSNGKSFRNFNVAVAGATVTLMDAFTLIYNLTVTFGTLTTNSNVDIGSALVGDSATMNMGSGTWTNRGGWGGYGTVNGGTSTLLMTYNGAAAMPFQGSVQSYYNNIQLAPGSSVLTFERPFTFNNMTMSSAGAKTVKFTKGTTYTMTGTNFLSGSNGNLVTLDTNDGTGTFTLNKTSGMTVADYVNVSNATVQGGAKWYLTPNSTQTNCTGFDTTNNNIRTVSAAGGNWDATTTWNEGVVPAAADEVYALPGSGNVTVNVNAVARNLNFYNYLGTLTHNAATSISVGDASGGYLNFAGNWTYTLGNATTSAINFVSTNNNSGNGWPINWGAKTPGNITINGSGGSWIFNDALNASATLTLIHGNLNTNSQTLNLAGINSSLPGAPYPVLTLGSSVITLGYWMNSYSNGLGGFTLNADTSTFFVSTKFNANGYSYNNVIFNGAGTPALVTPTSANSTFANLSRIGTAAKTDGLEINSYNNGTGQIVVNGTLNISGNSTTNRLLIKSDTLGTARTITAANVVASNVDFMDITAAGAANWNLSGISGGAGDCGGNTGITFTPGVTQTWTNAAGGNWSTAGNWSGRVPLPQDDVSMARVGGYNSGVTVTADMPRLGKSIDWTGATWTGTATKWTLSPDANACYGNLTLISNMTLINTSNYFYFSGRSSFNVTSAGKELETVFFSAPGGQYTLTDALRAGYALYVDAGSFVSAGNNINVGYFFRSTGLLTRSINISESVVTITANNPRCWDIVNTGLTMTPQMTAGSTLVFPYTGAGSGSIRGGSITYDNISFAGGGGGTITFEGSLNFSNLTMSSPGTKTVKFTKGTTYTMTGTQFLNGTEGNPITIDTNDGTGQFTLNKASGNVLADYLSISNSNVTGGANTKWYLGPNSTSVANNTGWVTPKYVSAAGGNWNATTTWSDSTVPTSTDDVFGFSSSGAVTLNTHATIRSIDLSRYTNTFTHNAATNLIVGDAGGGQLDFSGSWTYTKADAASSAIKLASTFDNGIGGWPVNTGAKVLGNFTVDGVGGAWTSIGNMVITGGNLTMNNGTFSGGTGTLDINGSMTQNNGNFNTPSGGFTLESNLTRTNGTFNNAAHVLNCDGTQAATIDVGVLNGILAINKGSAWLSGFTIANGTTVNLGANPTTTTDAGNITNNGTIIVDSGTWTLADSWPQGYPLVNNGIITHNGSGWNFTTLKGLTNSPGATISYAGSSLTIGSFFTQSGTFDLTGKTVIFNGSNAVVTANGSLGGTVVINVAFLGTFTVTAGTIINLGANPTSTISAGQMINNGTIVVDSGTWTLNDGWGGSGYAFTNNGSIVHNGDGWVFDNGKSLINNIGASITYAGTDIIIQGNLTQDGTFDLTHKNIVFSGADYSTIRAASSDIGSIQINKSNWNGYFNLGSDLSVLGSLTLSDGTFQTQNYNLNVGGNIDLSGDIFTAGTGTITANAASPTVQTFKPGSSSLYNLVHSGTGTLQLSTNNLTVTNALSNSDGTLDLNGRSVTTTGATFQNDAFLKLTGDETITGTQPTLANGSAVEYTATSGTRAIKNWDYAASNLIINGSGGTFTLPGSISVANLTVMAGTFSPGANTVTNSGDINLTGGTFTPGSSTMLMTATTPNHTITLGGQNMGNITFDSATGSWNFADAANFTGNFTVTNSSTDGSNGVNLNNQTIDVDGNFTLSAGKLALGSSTLSIGGNYTTGGGTLEQNTGTLNLNGSGVQAVTTGGKSLYNLTVANASASGVTFADPATVTNTFADTTPSSKLTFNSGSTYNFNNMNLNGNSANTRITLIASGSSNWTLNTAAASTVSYINVSKSTATGNVFCASYSNDGGANTNWYINSDSFCPPLKPSFVAATPAGYTTVNSFTFTWPAGVAPSFGIKWYEYKKLTDEAWSHTDNGTTTNVSGIESYQEGANVFLVRTIDNSDNISDYTQVTYYYSGSAPAKPTNVSISPETSDTNEFTISWDKSTVEAGDPPVVGYYYSINAAPTVQNITYIASQAEHISIGSSPFATLQGVNTVYVVGVNTAGNLSFEPAHVASATFTCVTAAPATPTSVSLYDASDRSLNRWMLTSQWLPGSGGGVVDRYNIERSINGTDFSSIATTEATAYIDASGLENTKEYYYRIKAVDNAGKESAPSSIVHRIPTGAYTTPPTILSLPSVSNIKSSAATIAWTTDRASTSIVRYGLDPSDLSASSGNMEAATSHSVTLLGLTPGSLYYYQVQSLDDNRDYSADSAYSTTYTFTTGSAPAISETKVENINLSNADISFKTTTVSDSKILYGLSSNYGSEVIDISGMQATEHRVKLTDLTPGTSYHFKIKSVDIDGNQLTSDDYQFDTLPLPKIEDLKIEPVAGTATSTMKATWTTNVPTTTILKYSPGQSDYDEKVTSKLETSHTITVGELSDNADYNIVASGRDELGNLAESATIIFKTPFDTRPAKISNVTIETSNVGLDKTDKAQIIVSWKTDEPATSQVEYAEGVNGSDYTHKTTEDKNLTTNHLVIIPDLTPGKPYHIRVVATDKGNNLSNSEDHTVIPGDVPKSALQIIVQTFTRLFGWLHL